MSLIISLVPAFAASLYQAIYPGVSNVWIFNLFLTGHHVYVNRVVTFLGIPATILQSQKTTKEALYSLSHGGLAYQGHVFNTLSTNWGYRFNVKSRDIYRFTLATPWGPQGVNRLAASSSISEMGQAYLLFLVHWRGFPRVGVDTVVGEKVLDCKEEKQGNGEQL